MMDWIIQWLFSIKFWFWISLIFNLLLAGMLFTVMLGQLTGKYSKVSQADKIWDLLRLFSTVIDRHEGYQPGHGERVAIIAVMLAQRLEFEPERINLISQAAFLHDIGELSISREILLKPGPLSAEDWEKIQSHPNNGAEILGRIERFAPLAEIVSQLHQFEDGSGYPSRTEIESEVDQNARIIQLAEVFDALINERPWRPAMDLSEAKVELKKLAEQKKLNQTLVNQLLSQ